MSSLEPTIQESVAFLIQKAPWVDDDDVTVYNELEFKKHYINYVRDTTDVTSAKGMLDTAPFSLIEPMIGRVSHISPLPTRINQDIKSVHMATVCLTTWTPLTLPYVTQIIVGTRLPLIQMVRLLPRKEIIKWVYQHMKENEFYKYTWDCRLYSTKTLQPSTYSTKGLELIIKGYILVNLGLVSLDELYSQPKHTLLEE